MGYINTGGQQVHTSSLSNSIFGTPSVSSGSLSIGTSSSAILTISGTNSLITSSTAAGQYLTWGGSTINYTNQKTKYHVLGEDIEVDGYSDPSLAVVISTLKDIRCFVIAIVCFVSLASKKT